MTHGKRGAIAAVALCSWMAAGIAHAQWVMLARHIVGRVETLSQQSKDGATNYVTATVIVDVAADKVFATVKRSIDAAKESQGVGVNRSDDVHYTIEFYRGDLSATIQVSSLGDNVAQLIVSSIQPSATTGPTLTQTIVDRVLSVCKQMNVVCSPAPR